MAILVNKNTTQGPLRTLGRTGTQSVRFIPAPRVYLFPPNYSSNPPVFFGTFGGATLSGAIDAGIVEGNAVVTLSRTVNPVFCGVDKMLVGMCSQSIRGQIDFTLSQFDDVTTELITGLSPASYTTNVYANYLVGAQPLTPVGLMLVVQGKLDGKEWQFYNPTALLSFAFDNQGDYMGLRVSGLLPGFASAGGTSNQILSVTIVSSSSAPIIVYPSGGYGVTPYGSNYGDPA
jgi:hypothetical protein